MIDFFSSWFLCLVVVYIFLYPGVCFRVAKKTIIFVFWLCCNIVPAYRILKLFLSRPKHALHMFKVWAASAILELLGVSTKRSRHSMEISYLHAGLTYTVVIKNTLTPSNVHEAALILEGMHTDVTSLLKRYMGVYGNFHGIPTSPSMIFKNPQASLKIRYLNGEEKVYSPNDVIDKF